MSRKDPLARSAIHKTLLALEHHAKGLKDVAGIITMYVANAAGWNADSSRGGANSWYLTGPNKKVVRLRFRPSPVRIEVSDGTVIQTRSQAIAWCERTFR